MASCSSCYYPTCPGAGGCGTLYTISDLIVTYAQQSDQTPTPPLVAPTSVPISSLLSAEQAPNDESDDNEENWEKKLVIKATEQRWDPNARHLISERKNRGKKRKRREYEEYEEEEYYEYNEYNEYFDEEQFDKDMQRFDEDMQRFDEDMQRMDDVMAAAFATVAAANASAPPAKRRKKAMRKKNKSRAAAGEGVAGPAPAGNGA